MAPPLYSAQLHPGRGLGFFALGTSLHDTLTRIKSEPVKFPKIDLKYDVKQPLAVPTIVELPANGIRFRFDGPEQRLRLIEIIDFTKNHVYVKQGGDKERDLVRPEVANEITGPSFKHIYQRFLGPTYAGEYIKQSGVYILSYPGVAFTFPMKESDYSPNKDIISLIPANEAATSMAIFSGESWAHACKTLWTEVLPSIKTHPPLAKTKDASADEVSLVKIHGGGKLQLFRKWTKNSFWIFLGETTPQQIVHELGPPDSIYYKNDQRMIIHRNRATSNNLDLPKGGDFKQDDLTDTDLSSHPASDDSSREEAIEDDDFTTSTEERFLNYFHQGFDILISTRTDPSETPPSQIGDKIVPGPTVRSGSSSRLVATKIVLHGNVPGSYPFNRHRRCRWEIAYLSPSADKGSMATSETPFSEVEESLREEWKSVYASESEAKQKQRGMVLNRGWGDSPGSSIELLGGWEDTSAGGHHRGGRKKYDGTEDSTTTLYGFPGLVFEVLKNGFVSAVTVF